MATNVYNDSTADTETLNAGTLLYRILPEDAPYEANSYNPNPPRALGDPTQGRFEPLDDALGGYLYVAETIAGAAAEGVLRGEAIGSSHLVRKVWLTGEGGKKLATLRLQEDVEVAALYGGHTAKLNLSATLLCGSDYNETRKTGTAVLTSCPSARGVKYRCANHDTLTSLMLITRSDPPLLEIDDEVDIFSDDRGRQLILKTLKEEFGLSYTGRM